jgi:HPt (histidine-containing phosphotransfer) domain-containing protein
LLSDARLAEPLPSEEDRFVTDGGPVLDRSDVLDRLGHDRMLVRRVADLFLQECPHLLSAVREASLLRDADEVARAAHTLKGALANLGAVSACNAALAAEAASREQDLTVVACRVKELETEIERFQRALMAWEREEFS